MAEQFKNRKEILDWLKTQPHEVGSVVAARAAMRVIPFLAELINNKELSIPLEVITSLTFHSVAIALSNGIWTKNLSEPKDYNPKIAASLPVATYVTYSASAAVYAATTSKSPYASAADATGYAASATHQYAANLLVGYDYYAIYYECLRDRHFIENQNFAQDLAKKRLWEKGEVKSNFTITGASREWKNLKAYLLSLNQDWDVWTDWYEDRLRGNEFQPFTLPFNVEFEIGLDPKNGQYGRVTFPPEDYKDPAKVNAQIKQVIEDYRARQAQEKPENKIAEIKEIANATPLAEDIILGEDGKFNVEFLPVRKLFDKNMSRIEDAVKQAITANAFNDTSPEIKFIQEILSNHADDPQRIHDDCGFVRSSIADLIKKDVIADDFTVKRLQDALAQTEMDIRAYEPDVKEAFETRLSLDKNELIELNDKELQSSNRDIQHIQSDRLKTETGEDIATVIGGERGAALYRLVSRFSRMYLQIQNAATTHTITDAANLTLMNAAPHLEKIIQQLRPFLGL